MRPRNFHPRPVLRCRVSNHVRRSAHEREWVIPYAMSFAIVLPGQGFPLTSETRGDFSLNPYENILGQDAAGGPALQLQV